MGQGMVIGNGGILHGPANIPYNAVVITKGIGNSIEGITVMKSRHFSMDIGEKGHIDNVKLFGYAYNNDGIVAGDYSLVENSFLKVNDDHIKLYHDHVKVRNCTFYVQNNGAVFQFAWNKINPGDHCLVENCEVVAVEFSGCGNPVSGEGGLAHCFISLREQQEDGRELINDTIRNILIQGQLLRFIGINGYTRKSVEVKGLVIENVTVENAPKWKSWVYSRAPYKMEIHFNQVLLGGKPISPEDFNTLGDVKLFFNGKPGQKPEYPLYSPFFGEPHRFSEEDLARTAHYFDFVYGQTPTSEEMKTATFEGIPRTQRHDWELWAYASYLLGVEKKGGKCVTKLGVPMFYREKNRRFVDIDPMYFWKIGEPALTLPADKILEYRKDNTEVFVREFTKSWVMVNPSDQEFTLTLGNPLIDPETLEKITTLTVKPKSGKILLKVWQ